MPDSSDLYDVLLFFYAINNAARFAHDFTQIGIIEFRYHASGFRKLTQVLNGFENTLNKASGNLGAGFGDV